MYATGNPKTKKELKERVQSGQQVRVFQPGPFGGRDVADGVVSVEGPHYPQPHKWYARVTLKDGVIVKVS